MPKVELRSHKNLTTFIQHGFNYKGESGNQVYGYSIFSGKDKFWINPETKAWDCKVSAKQGGFQKFLQEVHKFGLENITAEDLRWIRENRGLSRTTIKTHEVGFNPITQCFTIPVYASDKETIWDLRIYNKKTKKIIGTAGCNTGLYGWETLDKAKVIWLAEGEWDKMAMHEILVKTGRFPQEVVVSVPGVTVFKAEWTILFKDKIVKVAYDNDKDKEVKGTMRAGAAKIGSLKVYNILQSIAKEISFVHWNEDLDDGYDIRDLLNEKKDHEKCLSELESLLQPKPPMSEAVLQETEYNKEDEVKLDGEYIPYKQVYKEYKQWLYIPDTDVIDVIFGTLIANRLEGDPLWMFIVAPSGATKTEFLLSISDAPMTMSTTVMTPHSLVSGANTAGGGDPSLIPKLNGKILIIKDFTTILNMNQTARDEIFGILRDAYDGKTEKMFGNGVYRKFASKFGILAGVTPAIELYTEGQTALGERFLRFKVQVSDSYKDRLVYLKRAMSNVNMEANMKKELSELGKKVLQYDFKKIPIIPHELEEKVLYLAQWTAVVRGTVARDMYSKEVLARPFMELGTRLVKQYTKLLLGISMFKGKEHCDDEDFRIIRHIAMSSVPSDLQDITKYMYKSGLGNEVEHKDIVEQTRLPSENCRRKIENLCLLGVLNKVKLDGAIKTKFSITEEIFNLIKDGSIYD